MAYDRLDVPLLSVCVKLSTWNRALLSPGHGGISCITSHCRVSFVRFDLNFAWHNDAPRDEDVVVVESDAEITRVAPSVLCVGVVHAGVQDANGSFQESIFESLNNLTPTTRSNELASILYFFHIFSYLFHISWRCMFQNALAVEHQASACQMSFAKRQMLTNRWPTCIWMVSFCETNPMLTPMNTCTSLKKTLNLNNHYMWWSEVLVLKVTRWEVTYKSTK